MLWDFDGTLVDTRLRNYSVVRRLLLDVGLQPARFPALASAVVYDRVNRRYANWRDLYRREFGFSEGETDRIGALWGEYQARDDTPAEPFQGIHDVLDALAVPHGVVSQNARAQIRRALETAGLASHFRAIVGYDDVHIQRQKPEPDGLLAALEMIGAHAPARLIYIGDHETDVRCARNAARALYVTGTATEVVAIAACFVHADEPRGWRVRPDYVASTPRDLLVIARQLGLA